MKGRLVRLLDAVPTPPLDRFTWTDKRSKLAQIGSGLRKAVALIAGFSVMVAVFCGLVVLSDNQRIRSGGETAAWWAVLSFSVGVMLWTTHRWAPYVSGFFFGPAVLKLAVIFCQPDSYYSVHSISRMEIGGMLLYSLAVVGLTWRFLGEHPAPVRVGDRLALTFFALAAIKQAVIPYRFPPWPLLSGGLALFAAWASARFAAKTKHVRDARGYPA